MKKVDKLNMRDKEVVRFRILDKKSRGETAEIMGVEPITITRIMKKAEMQEYALELERKREAKHIEIYGRAFDKVMDIVEACIEELGRIALEGKDDKVRRDACRDIAFMAGLRPREAEERGKTHKLIVEEKEVQKKEKESA